MKFHSRLLSLTLGLVISLAPQAVSASPAPNPGTVVASRPAPDPLGPATSLTYATTRDDGVPTVASATVYEPTTPWPGRGPRPTVIIATSTRGQGDQCAPSRAAFHLASVGLGPAGPYLNAEYEYATYQQALAAGMRVVVPDYIGLGTPGHHSYVNTSEQAHALLDAARASLRLLRLPADSPVGFMGYSQGGGAAAAAAEYAAAYAPDLNIKGTFAGAPPADLKVIMATVDGSAIVHALGYSLNGFIERDPKIGDLIYPLLNERGRQFLASAATSCIPDSGLNWGLTRTETLTTTGESFLELFERIPYTSAALDRQKLGQRPLTGPIRLASSPTDDIIPFSQVQALGGAYCAMGGTVQLTAEPGPAVLPGFVISHLLPLYTVAPQGVAYLRDRFNDVPAPSNCR